MSRRRRRVAVKRWPRQKPVSQRRHDEGCSTAKAVPKGRIPLPGPHEMSPIGPAWTAKIGLKRRLFAEKSALTPGRFF